MKEHLYPYQFCRIPRYISLKSPHYYENETVNESPIETMIVNGTEENEERGEKDYHDDYIFKVNMSFTERSFPYTRIPIEKEHPHGSLSKEILKMYSPIEFRKQKRYISHEVLETKTTEIKDDSNRKKYYDTLPSEDESGKRSIEVETNTNKMYVEEKNITEIIESGVISPDSLTLLNPELKLNEMLENDKSLEISFPILEQTTILSLSLADKVNQVAENNSITYTNSDESYYYEKYTVSNENRMNKIHRGKKIIDTPYSKKKKVKVFDQNSDENDYLSTNCESENISPINARITENMTMKEFSWLHHLGSETSTLEKINSKPSESIEILDTQKYYDANSEKYVDIYLPVNEEAQPPHSGRLFKRQPTNKIWESFNWPKYKNQKSNLSLNDNEKNGSFFENKYELNQNSDKAITPISMGFNWPKYRKDKFQFSPSEDRTQHSFIIKKNDSSYNPEIPLKTSTVFWKGFNWPKFENSFGSSLQDSNELLRNDLLTSKKPLMKDDLKWSDILNTKSLIGSHEEDYHKDAYIWSKTESSVIGVNDIDDITNIQNSLLENAEALDVVFTPYGKSSNLPELIHLEKNIELNEMSTQTTIKETLSEHTNNLLSFSWPVHTKYKNFSFTRKQIVAINNMKMHSNGETIQTFITEKFPSVRINRTDDKISSKFHEKQKNNSSGTVPTNTIITSKTNIQPKKKNFQIWRNFNWPGHNSNFSKKMYPQLNEGKNTKKVKGETPTNKFESEDLNTTKGKRTTKIIEKVLPFGEFTSTIFNIEIPTYQRAESSTKLLFQEEYQLLKQIPGVSTSISASFENGKILPEIDATVSEEVENHNILGSDRKYLESTFDWPRNYIFNDTRDVDLYDKLSKKSDKTAKNSGEQPSLLQETFNWPRHGKFDYRKSRIHSPELLTSASFTEEDEELQLSSKPYYNTNNLEESISEHFADFEGTLLDAHPKESSAQVWNGYLWTEQEFQNTERNLLLSEKEKVTMKSKIWNRFLWPGHKSAYTDMTLSPSEKEIPSTETLLSSGEDISQYSNTEISSGNLLKEFSSIGVGMLVTPKDNSTIKIWDVFQWPEHGVYQHKNIKTDYKLVSSLETSTWSSEQLAFVLYNETFFSDRYRNDIVLHTATEYPTKLTTAPTKSTVKGDKVELVEDILNFRKRPEKNENIRMKGSFKFSPEQYVHVQVKESEDDDGLWNFRILKAEEDVTYHKETKKPFFEPTIYSFKPVGSAGDDWKEFNEAPNEILVTEPASTRRTRTTSYIWLSSLPSSMESMENRFEIEENTYLEISTFITLTDNSEKTSREFNTNNTLEYTSSIDILNIPSAETFTEKVMNMGQNIKIDEALEPLVEMTRDYSGKLEQLDTKLNVSFTEKIFYEGTRAGLIKSDYLDHDHGKFNSKEETFIYQEYSNSPSIFAEETENTNYVTEKVVANIEAIITGTYDIQGPEVNKEFLSQRPHSQTPEESIQSENEVEMTQKYLEELKLFDDELKSSTTQGNFYNDLSTDSMRQDYLEQSRIIQNLNGVIETSVTLTNDMESLTKDQQLIGWKEYIKIPQELIPLGPRYSTIITDMEKSNRIVQVSKPAIPSTQQYFEQVEPFDNEVKHVLAGDYSEEYSTTDLVISNYSGEAKEVHTDGIEQIIEAENTIESPELIFTEDNDHNKSYPDEVIVRSSDIEKNSLSLLTSVLDFDEDYGATVPFLIDELFSSNMSASTEQLSELLGIIHTEFEEEINSGRPLINNEILRISVPPVKSLFHNNKMVSESLESAESITKTTLSYSKYTFPGIYHDGPLIREGQEFDMNMFHLSEHSGDSTTICEICDEIESSRSRKYHKKMTTILNRNSKIVGNEGEFASNLFHLPERNYDTSGTVYTEQKLSDGTTNKIIRNTERNIKFKITTSMKSVEQNEIEKDLESDMLNLPHKNHETSTICQICEEPKNISHSTTELIPKTNNSIPQISDETVEYHPVNELEYDVLHLPQRNEEKASSLCEICSEVEPEHMSLKSNQDLITQKKYDSKINHLHELQLQETSSEYGSRENISSEKEQEIMKILKTPEIQSKKKASIAISYKSGGVEVNRPVPTKNTNIVFFKQQPTTISNYFSTRHELLSSRKYNSFTNVSVSRNLSVKEAAEDNTHKASYETENTSYKYTKWLQPYDIKSTEMNLKKKINQNEETQSGNGIEKKFQIVTDQMEKKEETIFLGDIPEQSETHVSLPTNYYSVEESTSRNTESNIHKYTLISGTFSPTKKVEISLITPMDRFRKVFEIVTHSFTDVLSNTDITSRILTFGGVESTEGYEESLISFRNLRTLSIGTTISVQPNEVTAKTNLYTEEESNTKMFDGYDGNNSTSKISNETKYSVTLFPLSIKKTTEKRDSEIGFSKSILMKEMLQIESNYELENNMFHLAEKHQHETSTICEVCSEFEQKQTTLRPSQLPSTENELEMTSQLLAENLEEHFTENEFGVRIPNEQIENEEEYDSSMLHLPANEHEETSTICVICDEPQKDLKFYGSTNVEPKINRLITVIYNVTGIEINRPQPTKNMNIYSFKMHPSTYATVNNITIAGEMEYFTQRSSTSTLENTSRSKPLSDKESTQEIIHEKLHEPSKNVFLQLNGLGVSEELSTHVMEENNRTETNREEFTHTEAFNSWIKKMEKEITQKKISNEFRIHAPTATHEILGNETTTSLHPENFGDGTFRNKEVSTQAANLSDQSENMLTSDEINRKLEKLENFVNAILTSTLPSIEDLINVGEELREIDTEEVLLVEELQNLRDDFEKMLETTLSSDMILEKISASSNISSRHYFQTKFQSDVSSLESFISNTKLFTEPISGNLTPKSVEVELTTLALTNINSLSVVENGHISNISKSSVEKTIIYESNFHTEEVSTKVSTNDEHEILEELRTLLDTATPGSMKILMTTNVRSELEKNSINEKKRGEQGEYVEVFTTHIPSEVISKAFEILNITEGYGQPNEDQERNIIISEKNVSSIEQIFTHETEYDEHKSFPPTKQNFEGIHNLPAIPSKQDVQTKSYVEQNFEEVVDKTLKDHPENELGDNLFHLPKKVQEEGSTICEICSEMKQDQISNFEEFFFATPILNATIRITTRSSVEEYEWKEETFSIVDNTSELGEVVSSSSFESLEEVSLGKYNKVSTTLTSPDHISMYFEVLNQTNGFSWTNENQEENIIVSWKNISSIEPTVAHQMEHEKIEIFPPTENNLKDFHNLSSTSSKQEFQSRGHVERNFEEVVDTTWKDYPENEVEDNLLHLPGKDQVNASTLCEICSEVKQEQTSMFETKFLATLVEDGTIRATMNNSEEEYDWKTETILADRSSETKQTFFSSSLKSPSVEKISRVPLITTLLLSLVASSTQHPEEIADRSGQFKMNPQENQTFPKCLVFYLTGENSNHSVISFNGTRWVPSESALSIIEETTSVSTSVPQMTQVITESTVGITVEEIIDTIELTTDNKNLPGMSTTIPAKSSASTEETNFIEGGCTQTDFENNNNCFCMLDLTVDHLAENLQDSHSSKLNPVECSNFLKVKTGLIMRNESSFSKRDKRSYLYLRYHHRKKREIVEYNKLDEVLANELLTQNNEIKMYAAVGSSVNIPCVYKNEIIEREHFMKYIWTYVEDKLVSHRVRETTDGVLKISDIFISDGGNYTCSVNRPFGNTESEHRRFVHELIIIERPIFKVKTSIMYDTDEICSLKQGDVVHSFLPKILEDLLCGLHKRVGRVEMERPSCVQMEDKTYLNIQYLVTLDPLSSLIPSLSYDKCDFNCQMKIYGSLVSLLIKNVETTTFLNIFSVMKSFNHTFKPKEVKFPTDRKAVEDTTLLPKLIIGCPPGFGIKQTTNKLCVACPRDSYSSDNSSFCSPCPFIHFQPNLGSTSCIECKTPFEDKSCAGMVLANKSFLIIYIGSTVAIIFLILLCVFCAQSVGTPAKKKKAQTPKRRRIGRRDIEDPAEKTLLLRDPSIHKMIKGPKVPPPDF